MNNKKVFGLIRHGETDWNIQRRMQGRENIPLNETGRQQSQDLGQLLYESGDTWDVIVSSPLNRALDTAKAIEAAIGPKPIIILDCLTERDFGLASGLTKAEARALFADGQIPGQESLEDLTTRVINGLEYLLHAADYQRILLVTHGEVLRVIYRLIGQVHKVGLKPGNASLEIVSISLENMCAGNCFHQYSDH